MTQLYVVRGWDWKYWWGIHLKCWNYSKASPPHHTNISWIKSYSFNRGTFTFCLLESKMSLIFLSLLRYPMICRTCPRWPSIGKAICLDMTTTSNNMSTYPISIAHRKYHIIYWYICILSDMSCPIKSNYGLHPWFRGVIHLDGNFKPFLSNVVSKLSTITVQYLFN